MNPILSTFTNMIFGYAANKHDSEDITAMTVYQDENDYLHINATCLDDKKQQYINTYFYVKVCDDMKIKLDSENSAIKYLGLLKLSKSKQAINFNEFATEFTSMVNKSKAVEILDCNKNNTFTLKVNLLIGLLNTFAQ